MTNSRYVWLASYPRSGNTWLRFLLDSLLGGRGRVDINAPALAAPVVHRDEFEQHLEIDSTLLSQDEIDYVRPVLMRHILEDSPDRYVLRKVHDKWRRNTAGEPLFPGELSLGALYVVRDPRDVAVSLSHFTSQDFDQTIAGMAEAEKTICAARKACAVQFEQPLGTWSAHVASWLDESRMPVHLVRYEDLLADTPGELDLIADFLEFSGPRDVRATAATARFQLLKEQEQTSGFREYSRRQGKFFRCGESGQWKTSLSSGQSRRIERDHREMMLRLGYLP